MSAGAAGPSQIALYDSATFTITVGNTGDATAHGLSVTVSFPDTPSKEAITGSSPDCRGNGGGGLVCPVSDLAAGSSASVTVTITAEDSGTLHHPFTVSSSDAGSASGEYDVNVPAPPPPPPPTRGPPTVGQTQFSWLPDCLCEGVGIVIWSNGYDTSWHVEYGVTSALGRSNDSTSVAASNGDTWSPGAGLHDLSPNTTYYWRIVAANQAGTTTTPASTFATGNVPPPASTQSTTAPPHVPPRTTSAQTTTTTSTSTVATTTTTPPNTTTTTTTSPAPPPPPGHARVPVFAGCFAAEPRVRPRSLLVGCGDGNFTITKLAWSRWDKADAAAVGVGHVNDCTPSCAAGHVHAYPVVVRLFRPMICANRKLEYTRFHYRFTGVKPAGARQRTLKSPFFTGRGCPF